VKHGECYLWAQGPCVPSTGVQHGMHCATPGFCYERGPGAERYALCCVVCCLHVSRKMTSPGCDCTRILRSTWLTLPCYVVAVTGSMTCTCCPVRSRVCCSRCSHFLQPLRPCYCVCSCASAHGSSCAHWHTLTYHSLRQQQAGWQLSVSCRSGTVCAQCLVCVLPR
jgi:hypothetical protein